MTKNALAERLTELRKKQRWSLRDAAEKTGVSKSMLSKIEHGLVSPTAATLGKLAEGFDLSISQLVSADRRIKDVVLLRRDDQPVFRVPMTGFERRSLSPTVAGGRSVDFVANYLPPRQSSGVFPPHRDGVEETLTVTTGSLHLYLGERLYALESGDAISYRANVAHRFDNPSDAQAAVFLIVVNNAGR